MDLKLKDVAELLEVSEATIRRWVSDGKIPGYRLNQQYRFSREEIDNWMMHFQVKSMVEEGDEFTQKGVNHFNLYRALHQGEVFVEAEGNSKEDLIRKTTDAIAGKLGVDAEVLSEMLIDREKMMPTALNKGVAVPHARDFLMPRSFDTVVVVFPKEPLDYGALDGQPVHTLFFLFACSDKRHLQLLAKIAHLISDADVLQFLQSRPDKTRLLEYIRTWEGNLVGNKR